MAEQQQAGSGAPPPKRSIDELIENLGERVSGEPGGHFLPLSFAAAEPSWPPYLPPPQLHQHHQQQQPSFLPPELEQQSRFLSARSNSQPSVRDDFSGFFNYGSSVFPVHEFNTFGAPPQQQQQHFRPPSDGFGLFGSSPPPPQPPQPPPQPLQERTYFENLMCNWTSPAGGGTYSPFGTAPAEPPPLHKPPQQLHTPQPPPPTPVQQLQQAPLEEKIVPKKRMVAEVKPMRPSYSDIVSKSPPTKPRNQSPHVCGKGESGGAQKGGARAAGPKKAANNKKNAAVKRQHSGDEPSLRGAGGRGSSPAPLLLQRRASVEEGSEDEERSCPDTSSQSGDSLQAKEPFKPAGRSKGPEGGVPLNNHKASRPGLAKRPLHINNNLNLPSRVNEKNVLKGTKQCKNCGEERRGANNSLAGAKNESKNNKSRSSSQTHDKSSGAASGRKGRAKKKDCGGAFSFSVLWPIVLQHLLQWGAVAWLAVSWFLHLLSDILGMSSKLGWHLCGSALGKARQWAAEGWGHVRPWLPFLAPPAPPQGQGQQRRQRRQGAAPTRCWSRWLPRWLRWGAKRPWEHDEPSKLEANLPLPTTGDEAMKRLLSCRGKDPYSILGVAPTCTDDEIKRYYKRQAFLVHPDKNSQPGAEEAFKILVHAFDLIGEPSKRQVYDTELARSHLEEAAYSELSDLLNQLHQKMEEAAHTIRCTNCGKRHKRIPVERPCYAARMCSQCKIHHSAREGDIWAESSVMGFLWYYYACMEGSVYDITEWAACQADNLRHLKANSHAVQYRIVLGKRSNNSGRSNSDSRRPADQQNEPDLEDFLNSLYSQANGRKGSDSPNGQSEQARKRKGRRKK